MWDCGSRPVKKIFENKNPDNRKKFLFGIFRTKHRFLGIFQGPIQHKNIVEKVEKRKNRPRKNYGLIMHNLGEKRKNRPEKITAL